LGIGTRQVAKNRICVLFEQAEAIRKTDPDLSRRYVEIARKIAMAARLRLPYDYKRKTCKKCNSLLVAGDNFRARIRQKREPHLVVTCLTCGSKTRIMLRKKKERTKHEQNKNQDETSR